MYQPNRSDIRPLTTAWRQSIIDPTKILSNDKQLSSGLVQKELCRDRADSFRRDHAGTGLLVQKGLGEERSECILNEFTSWCTGKKTSL